MRNIPADNKSVFKRQTLQSPSPTTTVKGAQGEQRALALLQKEGLTLVCRNFATPGRGGGEIDLVMRDPEGTLVFVEVRQRQSNHHGGAGASISLAKQRRLVFAAHHFLLRLTTLPPCRFDAILIEGDDSEPIWIQAAFEAGSF